MIPTNEPTKKQLASATIAFTVFYVLGVLAVLFICVAGLIAIGA